MMSKKLQINQLRNPHSSSLVHLTQISMQSIIKSISLNNKTQISEVKKALNLILNLLQEFRAKNLNLSLLILAKKYSFKAQSVQKSNNKRRLNSQKEVPKEVNFLLNLFLNSD